MTTRRRLAILLFACSSAATVGSDSARAWEATTTHAGLSERAALHSKLHLRIQQHFGLDLGLYENLRVPKADAPELFEILGRFNPSHGYVPDSRGRMSALSWLVAGSVLADYPPSFADNHFYDPRTGKGLRGGTGKGMARRLRIRSVNAGQAATLSSGGLPATSWWKSADNPLGFVGFQEQFRKAVVSRTGQERRRHLAGAMVSAGAMLHLLHDLGTPSHVRNDRAAHYDRVGSDPKDLGSRLERVATLAFGRLGIPRPADAPELASLDAHFSNSQGSGLADRVERSFFSAHTLPSSISVKRNAGGAAVQGKVNKSLARPLPAPRSPLDIIAARNDEGATLVNESGTCLARYLWREGKLSWRLDDECRLEQLEELLPLTAGYGVSFLDTLFPGDLELENSGGKILVNGDAKRYGKGKLAIFFDKADGSRQGYFDSAIDPDKGVFAVAPLPPQGTVRITAFFDGQGKDGQPLLATTTATWPMAK